VESTALWQRTICKARAGGASEETAQDETLAIEAQPRWATS
jgi:hypothetical protein